MIIHPLKPTYDQNSKILILGSFPSVKSRKYGYYYLNPQNRFWKVLAALYNEKVPEDIIAKQKFILKHNLALWDVIKACDIKGSADSSITNVEINDILKIIKKTSINKIFLNGNKAFNLYNKYLKDKISLPAIPLPSTSSANAGYKLEDLIEAWQAIKKA